MVFLCQPHPDHSPLGFIGTFSLNSDHRWIRRDCSILDSKKCAEVFMYPSLGFGTWKRIHQPGSHSVCGVGETGEFYGLKMKWVGVWLAVNMDETPLLSRESRYNVSLTCERCWSTGIDQQKAGFEWDQLQLRWEVGISNEMEDVQRVKHLQRKTLKTVLLVNCHVVASKDTISKDTMRFQSWLRPPLKTVNNQTLGCPHIRFDETRNGGRKESFRR